MDVSPCASVEECHLFGCGDCLGSGLGEVIAGGCPSVWGALADRMDRKDDYDCPNKIWKEECRFSLRDCGAWHRIA